MGVESAIGYAIIGYGIAGYAAYAASSSAKADTKAKNAQRDAELGRGGAPAMPSFETAGADSAIKKTARRRTSTILTSPLKGGEEFGTAAPTLLGSGVGKKLTGE